MTKSPTLAGRTALVTGGARRLGKAVSVALAEHGVNVVVHCNRSEAEAALLTDSLSQIGVKAWSLAADFNREEDVARVMTDAISAAGPIDILINSASIFPSDTLDHVDAASLEANIQVNALVPLMLSRAFAAQNREGAIVNFLDTRILDYDREHVSYHLSKRMLFTLTRITALEFAPRVRVNAVAPGLVLPPEGKDESYLQKLAHSNPMNRFGAESDITRAVIFLLESSFVTGQVIYVDGGRHLKAGVYH